MSMLGNLHVVSVLVYFSAQIMQIVCLCYQCFGRDGKSEGGWRLNPTSYGSIKWACRVLAIVCWT
jgi:hypothetical protein